MIRYIVASAAGVLACSAAATADVTELIVGHTAAGRLRVRLTGTLPVELDPSVFPGFPGWAEAEPGFESTTLDDPGDDFFIPAASSEMQWVLIALGPGIEVLNEHGSAMMAPGETFYLGIPFFDVHPLWTIPAGVPGQPTWLRIVIHDLTGTYADSAEQDLTYQPAGCYANCDGSTVAPLLNVLDFSCFLNRLAAGDSYANCDQSTTAPVLNVLDFSCFLNRFAAGCD